MPDNQTRVYRIDILALEADSLANPKPCMQSGFCCTQSPCPFGEWDEARHQCTFLGDPNDVGQRLCLKYDEIRATPGGGKFSPAFGTVGDFFFFGLGK